MVFLRHIVAIEIVIVLLKAAHLSEDCAALLGD